MLGRGSGVGRLEVGVSRITLGEVTSGLLLPLRVRAPNVDLVIGNRRGRFYVWEFVWGA